MRHKDIVLRQMCAPHNEILFEWLRWCKISIFRDKNMARKNEMQGMFYNEFMCNCISCLSRFATMKILRMLYYSTT
jgi:hypothetical protein